MKKRSAPLFIVSSSLVMLVILLAAFAAGSSGSVRAAPRACVPGPHTGVITVSQEWCLGDTHQLTGDVTVAAGVTLTVQPGVIVLGASGTELKVQGTLEALGTAAQPITLTSVADSGPGQWSGLLFDGGTGHLRHAIVRYWGQTNSQGIPSGITARNMLAGELRIEDGEVSDGEHGGTYDYALYVEESRVSVSDTSFINNGDWSRDAVIYIVGADSVVTMAGNTFAGNSRNRVLLATGAMMGQDATLTPHTGLQAYELEADYTVPPTVTLTLEPGVTLMGGQNVELEVQGHLQALGTPEEPITFTSAINTDAGQWAGLVFDGGTGHLRHATVRYAGHSNSAGTYSNIAVQETFAGQVSLESSQVLTCETPSTTEYGLYVDNGRAIISDTLFSGNGNGGAAAPFYITGASSIVTMTENSFIGNSRDRVVLAPGAMMGHDTTLTPQSMLQGYQLASDFTVPPTVTLTLEPGVTLMGGGDVELEVEGHLQALGTPGEFITFTSVINTDGGQWAGLVFDGGTGHLRHATVRYAGHSTSAGTRSNITVHETLSGQVSLESCQVQESAYAFGPEYGLYVDNGRAIISDTLFLDIGNGVAAPLYITGPGSVVTMTENSFIGNARDRIVLGPEAMMGQDATLTPQTVPFELASDLTVPPTVTLTIEPGVTLMGARGIELKVGGHLEALGTPETPITFTSVADSGGGEWSGLIFDGGTGHLRHATVRYGGESTSVGVLANIAVRNTAAGEVHLESCQVFDSEHYSTDYGIHVVDGNLSTSDTTVSASDRNLYVGGDSTVLIDSSVIKGATSHGVLVEGDQALLHVTNSMIVSNAAFSGDGIRNTGEATVMLGGDPEKGNLITSNPFYGANQTGLTGRIMATYNYWGDPSGPEHADNPGGTGQQVSDRVFYDPWLTEVPTGTASAENLVDAVSPRYVSPGETVNLGYIVHNVLTETLTNAVVVAHLPIEVTYLHSSPAGEYWPDRQQVVWKLGDLAPDEVIYLVVQVRYQWGLAAHHMTYSNGSIVAENLASDLLDLDEYLAYEELTILSFEELTQGELTDLLAADAALNALYVDAESQGFVYYGGARLEHLSDGRDQVSLVMIDTSKQDEQIFLHRIVDQAHRIHSFADHVLGNSPTASYDYTYQTGETAVWNPFGTKYGPVQRSTDSPCSTLGCDDYGYFDCLRNCLINSIHSNQFNPVYSSACSTCYKYGTAAACNSCAASMAYWRSDIIKNSVDACEKSCNIDDQGWKCDEPNRECSGSYQVLVTPCVDCEYDTQNNYLEPCGENTRCINGECEPIDDPTEVVTAHDPNDILGPLEVIPGQTISFTIRYENVGAGTAYGVNIESELPAVYDPSTVQIHDGGLFFSSHRVLLWEVGELGPGAGGQVSFQVQVPPDVPSGTVILASATVYFPSVPETTPTGELVTIVRDVAAHSQFVETMEGVPADITLTGLTPTGNPLTFEILDEPLWGTLTGTLPSLIFSPAAGYEGGDSSSFRVSDGIGASSPAQVSIQVNAPYRIYLPLVVRQ